MSQYVLKPGYPSAPQVMPGYGMPASAANTGGGWFDKLLNVAAAGYSANQGRKLEQSRMQQEALLKSIERDSQPEYAPTTVKSPVDTKPPAKQWISGVENQTVILAGAAILLGAMVLK